MAGGEIATPIVDRPNSNGPNEKRHAGISGVPYFFDEKSSASETI